VRAKGSEIGTGELALSKGTVLSPAATGFLAGMGATQVKVFAHPAIHLIVTGNELQQRGKALRYGQVYESSSVMLSSVLQQLHFSVSNIVFVEDDVAALTDALQISLQQADVVLLTGGVSAGDYDFVIKAATACGVQQLFHKIKQRPGKPLYFGMLQSKVVFGLPGNPSSVLTCFYEYVWDALLKLASLPNKKRKYHLPLASAYSKKAGLTHFLKGKIVGDEVMPLTAQESYRLSSFAVADCLIVLEEDQTDFNKGDIVEVHILPQ
jgi:molybdopterin molybdotransferase